MDLTSIRAAYRRYAKIYDATFGKRMRGEGLFAELLAQRFAKACDRLGINRGRGALDTTQFRPPGRAGQMALF